MGCYSEEEGKMLELPANEANRNVRTFALWMALIRSDEDIWGYDLGKIVERKLDGYESNEIWAIAESLGILMHTNIDTLASNRRIFEYLVLAHVEGMMVKLTP